MMVDIDFNIRKEKNTKFICPIFLPVTVYFGGIDKEKWFTVYNEISRQLLTGLNFILLARKRNLVFYFHHSWRGNIKI